MMPGTPLKSYTRTHVCIHNGALNAAALVRAAALEEAAVVCETQGHGRRALEHYASLTYAGAAHDCVAAILALKEQT